LEVEDRLARNGFDAIAVNAEVFIRARNEFAMFDSLMHAAQHRRMVLLREIGIRREAARRALAAETSSSGPKYIISHGHNSSGKE
jgi:hypothetical protein